MSSKKRTSRKLTVKKESLRKLDSGSLNGVAGGALRLTDGCTLRGGAYTVECPNTGGCWTM